MITLTASKKCLISGQNAIGKHNYRAAHEIAIRRLHEDVNDPAPYYLLARIAEEHGNTSKAEELFAKSVNLSQNQALYISAYAKILSIRGKQGQAHEENNKAAALEIKDAHIADTIGVVYSRIGFHEKAIPFFKKAVSINSALSNFHFNLGTSLQFLGKFQDAAKCYKTVIAQDPNHVRAYSALIGLEKQTQDQNHLLALYPLFAEHKNDADLALHIGHAIAKTLEDLEQYEESLQWLMRAKQKKLSLIPDDSTDAFALFEAAKKLCQPQKTSQLHSDKKPIFIIGLPRTGTTLLDRIVSTHKDVISCGELGAFSHLIKKGTKTTSRAVLDKETLEKAGMLSFADIGQEYWRLTEDLRQGFSRMTDKMPLNFFYANLIHQAFPEARILALRRNAMDSCLSNYRQLFSTSYSYYNYTFSLDNTAAYYRAFDGLMNYWRKHLPSNRFTEIHYEDIVFDQENQTRRILEFCDLDWDENCLNFHENKSPVSTASSVQVRQPLYSGSVGRWKKYGDALNDLRDVLGDLAE
jgi:tetratricopeptide (TPR) repeat protein